MGMLLEGGSRRGAGAPNEVSRVWDAEAARYDRTYDSSNRAGRFLRSRHAAVLRVLGDPPGPGREPGELLDVGMGPGRALAELAARGWRVSGVDISERMVALAKRRVPGARERLLCASLERLPFADASFDAVIATGLFSYAGYSEENFARLGRVLRPGGIAVLSMANRWSLYRLSRHGFAYPVMRAVKGILPFGRPAPLRHHRPPARWAFEQLLGGAGLRVESVQFASGGQLVYAARKAPATSDARFAPLPERLSAS
jgi:SAM-dependent methyltransferase